MNLVLELYFFILIILYEYMTFYLQKIVKMLFNLKSVNNKHIFLIIRTY